MNQLIIIGNGFDLAHKLETSYKDFLKWYIIKIMHSCKSNGAYEDKIFRLFQENKSLVNIKEIDFKISIIETFRKYGITCQLLHADFFEIISDIYSDNWADLEFSFYKILVRLYQHGYSKNFNINPIKVYNEVFDFFKNQLVTYLNTINKDDFALDHNIQKHINKIINPIANGPNQLNKVCIINFNYTNTIEYYLKNFKNRDSIEIINIHGCLKDNNSILGYGDMMDENFTALENTNKPEFLNHIKQYYYQQSTEYSALENIVNLKNMGHNTYSKYDLHIMGHSCGISDRVLLNKLFNPETCNSIKIYYYKRKDGSDDFFEKTQNIIRNFSKENKPNFGLIQNKKISSPLTED